MDVEESAYVIDCALLSISQQRDPVRTRKVNGNFVGLTRILRPFSLSTTTRVLLYGKESSKFTIHSEMGHGRPNPPISFSCTISWTMEQVMSGYQLNPSVYILESGVCRSSGRAPSLSGHMNVDNFGCVQAEEGVHN